jgi:hypothetical protein
MKKSLFILFALLFGLMTFNACQKDEDEDFTSEEITQAEDLAINTDLTEDLDYDADVIIEDRGGPNPTPGCPTVTFAQPWGTWPNTITVDFGTGCQRPSGRVLKGKLIINQSAGMLTPGAVRTTTHEDFFVDDVQVEGTRTWTNDGLVNGLLSFTKTVTDMQLTYADGSTTTWDGQRTHVLAEGGTTLTWLDDRWQISGSTTGTTRNGLGFTATITEPLVKRAACRWISAGVITYTRNQRTFTLNFGDGTCDQFAILTGPNGNSMSIRLHR